MHDGGHGATYLRPYIDLEVQRIQELLWSDRSSAFGKLLELLQLLQHIKDFTQRVSCSEANDDPRLVCGEELISLCTRALNNHPEIWGFTQKWQVSEKNSSFGIESIHNTNGYVTKANPDSRVLLQESTTRILIEVHSAKAPWGKLLNSHPEN